MQHDARNSTTRHTDVDPRAGNRDDGPGYFGDCPICHKNDGYVNVGTDHWFVCATHKKKWCIGANLFSSAMDETPEQQAQEQESLGLDSFEVVEPFYPPASDDLQLATSTPEQGKENTMKPSDEALRKDDSTKIEPKQPATADSNQAIAEATENLDTDFDDPRLEAGIEREIKRSRAALEEKLDALDHYIGQAAKNSILIRALMDGERD